jgi:hypothetical protein
LLLRAGRIFGLFSLLLAAPVWACDSGFIQEPTSTPPVVEMEDLWTGFLTRIFVFPTGETLITMRTMLSFDQESTTFEAFPFYYLIQKPGQPDRRYTDHVGDGKCWNIERY